VSPQIYGRYDVVVVGGGASGVAAGIAAARAGARTIVIERLGALGGMVNITGPPGWAFSHLWNNRGEEIIAGFVKETHDKLEAMGCALPYPAPHERIFDSFALIDADWWGLLAFKYMQELNVQLLLHTLAVDVVMEGNSVKGVVVENINGRQIVFGKVVIDCTGEGDIAARAGVPYIKADRTKEELDPPSVGFYMDGVNWKRVTEYFKQNPDEFVRFPSKPVWETLNTPAAKARREKMIEELKKCDTILDLVKRGILGYVTFYDLSEKAVKNGDIPPLGVDLGFFFSVKGPGPYIVPVFQHSAQVPDCDTTDVRELSYAEMECRRQIIMAANAVRKYIPGFENAYVSKVMMEVRTREGRHFIGDYMLTSDDVAAERKFPDVIGKSAMSTAIGGPFHSCRFPAESMNIDPNTKRVSPPTGGSYDIPYRCLVPKNVENLLLAGKLLSVSLDFKRDQLPENIITGQAAGVAAAVCAKRGITPRQLEDDVSEVQQILIKQGAILFGTH